MFLIEMKLHPVKTRPTPDHTSKKQKSWQNFYFSWKQIGGESA